MSIAVRQVTKRFDNGFVAVEVTISARPDATQLDAIFFDIDDTLYLERDYVRSGFAAASKDLVFYTDGDGQYDVGELPLLLMLLTPDTDFVNGMKMTRQDPPHRVFFGNLHRFPDAEVSFQIDENIRGTDVFVVQPTAPPVNEHLVELLAFRVGPIFVRAARAF